MTNMAAVARLPRMDGEKRMPGTDIRTRRAALGLTATKLAKLAEVSREHLSEVETGRKKPSDAWVRRVVLAMDKYEVETGQDEPPAIPVQAAPAEGLIEFDITGDFGVHVIVKGPVVNADLLRRQAAALIAEIRGKRSDEE